MGESGDLAIGSFDLDLDLWFCCLLSHFDLRCLFLFLNNVWLLGYELLERDALVFARFSQLV